MTPQITEPEPTTPLRERTEVMRDVVRPTSMLPVFDAVMSSVDPARHAALVERLRPDIPPIPPGTSFGGNPLKYLDIAYWVRSYLRTADSLALDRGGPLRILDIGSGGGHFMAICSALGHDPMGMDIPEPAFLGDLVEMLGQRRFMGSIQPLKAMSAGIRGYDLIVADHVVFDRNPTADRFWTLKRWRFFIEDALARLNPGGRLFIGLNLNHKPYGASTSELFAMAETLGAKCDPVRGHIELRTEA